GVSLGSGSVWASIFLASQHTSIRNFISHLSNSESTGTYGRRTRRTEIDASATTLRPSRAAELVFGHTSENRMGTGGPSPSRAGRVAVIDTNMLRRSVLCSP